MNKLLYLTILLCACLVITTQQEDSSSSKNVINLLEKASNTLRLKSVLHNNVLATATATAASTNDTTRRPQQQIFWLFKRIYALPSFDGVKSFTSTRIATSQQETMISLDTEVQSNLNTKFSIDTVNFDLLIHNLTFADSGLYICNQWNQKAIHYQLLVASPIGRPQLTVAQNKSKQLIAESSNLTLTCTSQHAYPYPTIKWYHNQKELTQSSHSISFKLADKEQNKIESQLSLVNLTSEFHLSNFTCKLVQAEDEHQEQLWQTSDIVTVNIGFKPIVNIELVNKTKLRETTEAKLVLYDDTDVKFKCNFKSNPVDELKIEWKLNNVVQQSNGKTNEFDWLKRSNRNDFTTKQMILTCQVTNVMGSSSASYQITLIHEPIVIVEKSVYEVDELGELQVHCHIDSSPPPTQIEWRHYSSSSLTNDSKPEIMSRSQLLQFKSIKHTDTNGYFVCSAQNEMVDSFGLRRQKSSRQSAQIEINVRFMPQKLGPASKKLAVNLSHTTSRNLTCLTLANPQPVFNWYRNGVQLSPTSSPTSNKYTFNAISSSLSKNSKHLYENVLTINNLNDVDLNVDYECEAVNALGTNRIKLMLVALSRPDKPTEFNLIHTDFMSVYVAWSPDLFDGGLASTFEIKLNDSLFNLSDSTEAAGIEYKNGSNSVQLNNLNYDTVYSLRLRAHNRLGSSEWSEPLIAKTNDLTNADLDLLPVFDSLFLNVPKNQLEYRLVPLVARSQMPKFCFQMSHTQDNTRFKFNKCIRVDDLLSKEQLLFDSLVQEDLMATAVDDSNRSIQFKANKAKSLQVSICFHMKQSICSAEPFNAIIDTYDRISHSSILAFNSFKSSSAKSSMHTREQGLNAIPVSLITGICVCILLLLIILFICVLYCIRKRNFKLCKNLLQNNTKLNDEDNQTNTEKSSKDTIINTNFVNEQCMKTHGNKSFNVDLPSSSSSNNSTSDGYGSAGSAELNLVNASSTSTGSLLNAAASKRSTLVTALSQTASNLINNTLARNRQSEILVTEDEEQQEKIKSNNRQSQIMIASLAHHEEVSSTGSSSLNHNQNQSNTGIYIYSDLNYNDTSNHHHHHHHSHHGNNNNNNNNVGGMITYVDTYNTAGGGSASASSSLGTSNTDPIAINNSLSSTNSSVDSPTYGYNVAAAALSNACVVASSSSTNLIHHNNQNHNQFTNMYEQMNSVANSKAVCVDENNSENLIYIKNGCLMVENFVQVDEQINAGYKSLRVPLQQNRLNSFILNSNQNNQNQNQNGYIETPESGYSTPSRPKKVVYEVIV